MSAPAWNEPMRTRHLAADVRDGLVQVEIDGQRFRAERVSVRQVRDDHLGLENDRPVLPHRVHSEYEVTFRICPQISGEAFAVRREDLS